MDAKPDWVIIGAPLPDGRFEIMASTALTYSELEMEREELDFTYGPFGIFEPMLGPAKYSIKVGMKKYVILVGDSYSLCLRALFEQSGWSPDGQVQEIES